MIGTTWLATTWLIAGIVAKLGLALWLLRLACEFETRPARDRAEDFAEDRELRS